MSRKYDSFKKNWYLIPSGLIAISSFSFLAYTGGVAPFVNHQVVTDCVVIGKTTEENKRGVTIGYKIDTENCGTFQIKNSIFLQDYGSAGRYDSIDPFNDVSYDFETYGYDVLWLHPVITKVITSDS